MTNLTSIRVNNLGRFLPVAFAAAALALFGARAHAADSDQVDPVQLDAITVSVPPAKIVDRPEWPVFPPVVGDRLGESRPEAGDLFELHPVRPVQVVAGGDELGWARSYRRCPG